ncbi:acyl-CoA thioesterase [uncultured Desulfobacter sp.]|uniref:acyl-CoA thioesterase n=1 Tax=uncultured Desulfobacter sp. TaxID=240139 RepID=UPI0029F5731E|nr:acyl-CoA thioesterase [uncultured Desulfobacter sp.]
MIKTMKSTKRVNFEDCDPFSHLNNANYINYFLTAREEQLRTNDVLNIFEHVKATGNGWAVTSHNILYLKPSLLGEELEIWSRMVCFDRFRNLVEFIMICPEKKQLKSVMHSEFAYIDIKKANPVPLDDQMLDLFKEVSLFPEKEIASIEIKDRLKQIKTEIL